MITRQRNHGQPHNIPNALPGNRVVAFIDIMGFRDAVGQIFEQEEMTRYQRLFRALNLVLTHSHATQENVLRASDAQATAFSDSIVISDDATPIGIGGTLARSALLASWLLQDGLTCRGAVTVGPTHHRDGLLLGPGLIHAYDLEKGSAIYPRILVTEQLADMGQPYEGVRLKRDSDGFWFIDVFHQFQKVRGFEGTLASLFYSSDYDLAQFLKVRVFLETQLLKFRGKERIFSKYYWLAKKFNAAVNEYVPEKVQLIATG